MKKFLLKIPKIKLSYVLLSVFIVLVIFEGLVLYRYVYVSEQLPETVTVDEGSGAVHVNFEKFDDAVEWMSQRDEFTLPQDDFGGRAGGRNNPFLEY